MYYCLTKYFFSFKHIQMYKFDIYIEFRDFPNFKVSWTSLTLYICLNHPWDFTNTLILVNVMCIISLHTFGFCYARYSMWILLSCVSQCLIAAFYGHVSFWLTARACLMWSVSSHWTLIMDVCLLIWWHQSWSEHPVFVRHACTHKYACTSMHPFSICHIAFV